MSVIEVNTDNFQDEVLDSGLPVLLDFYSPTCPPCLAIAPILGELADEFAGRAKVVKINDPDNPVLSDAFRISAYPTLVILKNGRQVARFVGLQPKANLRKALESAA